MKTIASLVLTLAAVLLLVMFAACGGGNAPGIVTPNITVAVSASVNSVIAAGTDAVTATVTGDSSNKGVTWTVSCAAAQCGTVSSSTSSGSGTFTATYTAPSTPPSSDLVVTIKASSVADSTKSGTTTATVLAITISVSPSSASVQAGATNTVSISASTNNDPSGQGVSWSITPASGAGTLTGQNSNSVTYNAPTTPPSSDETVTVTATSIEDSTKSAAAAITVSSVTISIAAPTTTVDAAGTIPNIVATVGNDATNKGVSWAVSCATSSCGSFSPSSTLSGVATTYSAPATPPESDLPVTVTATSVADPAAQTSITITIKAISVSVTAPQGTVQFNGTVSNIVAVVNDDPAHKGVTWAITCDVAPCGSVSPTATASGQAVTYTAPSTPPASDLGVTITATSDSDPNQQGSVSITVLAIRVTVSPSTAFVPVGATAALNATPFTPTVSNDSSNGGATWTVTQSGTACSPACGTITPASTASGTATTYAAPSTVPANATVTLTATSVTDGTKAAIATITLTAGTVKLIPAALKFGRIKITSTSHPTQTLTETLTNTGSSALNITNQAIGGGPYSVTAPCQGSLTTSVASGASCTISVKFAPLAAGTFDTNLAITDDDTTSPQQVPISGSACTICRGIPGIRAALAKNPVPAVPSPSGPFRIGTRVMDLTDANRADPYLANGARRELLVRFWYPASIGNACQPAQYTSQGVWNYLAQIEKIAPPLVKTNSCQDAPISADKHPVVVFTHGYTGTFTDYTFLFEDLASRGYVVASVDHTFEAAAVEFPDHRLVKSVVGNHLADTLRLDAKSTWSAVAVRLADLKFVMDELERMNAKADSPFAGKFDMSRVALAGHSLGGMTTLLGIEMEPRFRAAVSLDGVTPGPLFGSTTKPVMMLFAGRDPWNQDTCRAWENLHGPRLAVSFKGSEHLTPSDAVWLANGAILTGTMGMETTVSAVRNYVAAFLDTNVNGNPADRLLETASPEYPDVEVTAQAQSPCGTGAK